MPLCAQKSPPAKPIDINTANIEQLQQLPGIGPVTAQSILDFRKKSGPFRRAEDLLAIRGISESRFKAIAPYVVFTAEARAPQNAASPHRQSLRAPNRQADAANYVKLAAPDTCNMLAASCVVARAPL